MKASLCTSVTCVVLYLLLSHYCVTLVEANFFRSFWTSSSHSGDKFDRREKDGTDSVIRPAHRLGKPLEIAAAEAALVADLQRKSSVSACWKDAVAALQDGCKLLATIEEKRSRVALQFLHCQVQLDGKRHSVSGEPLSVSCPSSYDVKHCVQQLDDSMYPLYVQFRLHVDSLCFHAQEELFQERTEAAVHDLGRAAATATSRLQGIAAQTDGVKIRLSDLQLQQELAANVARDIHSDLASHAASQSASLELLSDRTVGLLNGINSAQEAADRVVMAQETGIALIREDLGAVASQQAMMFDATKSAALALQELLGHSVAELQGHRLLIENVSAAARVIAADANEQHLRVEKANQAIFDVLEHVHGMQSSVHSTVTAVSTGLYYFGLLIAVMLVTTTPRTSDARALCLLLSVLAGWIEVWVGVRVAALTAITHLPAALSYSLVASLSSVELSQGELAVDQSLRWGFRSLVAACLLGAVVYNAVTYVSPDAKIRRFLKEELHALFGPRLVAVDAILNAAEQYEATGENVLHWTYDSRTAATTLHNPPAPIREGGQSPSSDTAALTLPPLRKPSKGRKPH